MFILDGFKNFRPEEKLFCFEGEEQPPAGGVVPPETKKTEEPNAEQTKKDREEAAARMKADNEKLRKDNEAEVAKRKEAEAKLEEAERKKLEEEGKWKEIAEKEQKRVVEAKEEGLKKEREFEARIVNTELRAKLISEGLEDVDLHVLADKSKISYENGEVKGLDEVVTDLRTRKPHLFKKVSANSGTVKNPAAIADKDLPVKDVSKMSPAEYHEYKKSTLRLMRGGR